MNFKRAERKLNKLYKERVTACVRRDNRSIVLSGELDTWEDILKACNLFVNPKGGWHVVNHIALSGVSFPEMRVPALRDEVLDGERPDVLIIGGGIVGAAVLRELTRYELSVLLVEKESDLAVQQSSRNDGEVHPGVDQKHKNLKLKYELMGNRMYPALCAELGVPFKRNGQYVAFKSPLLRPVLEIAAAKKRRLGVKDTKVISKKALYAAVPNLNPGYHAGIYNPSAGTVCPYGLAIACGENALNNGGKISLNTAVLSMEVKDKKILSVRTNRGTVYPKLVINAAGIFSDKVAAMAEDEFFSIHPRRGTEVILDRKKGDLTDAIVSYRDLIPKGEKNTKGGGILHTVDHNILVGPDAVETFEREDFSTTKESISALFNKQKRTISKLDEKDIITWFTGIRAATFEEDFIFEKGRSTENILHIAGIQSPGLTAAPALAVDAAKTAAKMLGGIPLKKNFDPVRKPIPKVRELPDGERARLIKENPDYGVIVCRCEEISKGEILDALKSPLFVPTLDGVKRRVRPGMGRCQGGFCGPLVFRIIEEYAGLSAEKITKSGEGSEISFGGTK